MYGKTFKEENSHVHIGKWLFVGNFHSNMLVDLILPIDKAIIHGKRFVIEWKTVKTGKVFPFKSFTIYGTTL